MQLSFLTLHFALLVLIFTIRPVVLDSSWMAKYGWFASGRRIGGGGGYSYGPVPQEGWRTHEVASDSNGIPFTLGPLEGLGLEWTPVEKAGCASYGVREFKLYV